MKIRVILCSLILILLAQPAFAQAYKPPADMEYFKSKKPPSVLDADAGYIFMRLRTGSKKYVAQPTLIRLQSDENDQDNNVYQVWYRKKYRKAENGQDLFFKLKPGTYILYDMGGTCLCLGSVQFDVKPGEITDMGLVMADVYDRKGEASIFPEIQAFTKGHADYGYSFFATAIRPTFDGMAFPAELTGLKRTGAVYKAKGKMPNFFSSQIDRLAPMPGILDYRGDAIIDERTGQVVD